MVSVLLWNFNDMICFRLLRVIILLVVWWFSVSWSLFFVIFLLLLWMRICLCFFFLILILIWLVFVLRLFFNSFLIMEVGCFIILLVVIWFVNWGDNNCIGKGKFVYCFNVRKLGIWNVKYLFDLYNVIVEIVCCFKVIDFNIIMLC